MNTYNVYFVCTKNVAIFDADSFKIKKPFMYFYINGEVVRMIKTSKIKDIQIEPRPSEEIYRESDGSIEWVPNYKKVDFCVY